MRTLEVSKLNKLINSTTGTEFMQAILRPVSIDASGKTRFSGFESGSKNFNVGREPNVGDLFEGDIYHYQTTPYMINGREVEKITVVAASDEKPVDIANAQLAKSNACVILNGKPTVKLKASKPVATPVGEDQD